jgi:hypothetical protein
MIDRLVEDIDSEIDADGGKSRQEVTDSGEETVEKVGDVDGEYTIEIRRDGSTLSVFDSDSQSDVMADAVDYLIQNYNLVSEISPLPYIPGREKAIINVDPTSPHDEEAMRNYRELSGGYYLDTHTNKEGKKRTVRRLVKKCDVSVAFLRGW